MSLDGDSVSSVGLVAGADQQGGGLTLAQGRPYQARYVMHGTSSLVLLSVCSLYHGHVRCGLKLAAQTCCHKRQHDRPVVRGQSAVVL